MGPLHEAPVDVIDLTIEDIASAEKPCIQRRVGQLQDPRLLDTRVFNNDVERHSWKPEERLVLKMLREQYGNNWEDLVAIFNTVFKHAVPTFGLTKEVVRTQYASFTKDPRHRINSSKFLEEVIMSEKSTLTSEEVVVLLIETTAVQVGNHLVKNRKSVQPVAAQTPYTPTVCKRSHNQTCSDDEDQMMEPSAKAPRDSYGRTSNLSLRRWSGLNPKTPTDHQAVGHSLRTPPSSKGASQFAALPGSRSTPNRTRSLPEWPIVLVSPTTHRPSLSSRSSPSSTTVKTETAASIYVPSASEEADEEFCCSTPSPSPSWSGETISPEPTDDEDDEESVVMTHGESTPEASQRPIEGAELPLLGFRGYSGASQGLNGEHGFRAGAFMNIDEVPPCPDIQSR